MERHYLVVNSFVGNMGFKIVKGDIGVPGDSASPEVWDEINKQVKAGNLKAIGEGERGREPLSRYVALESDKKEDRYA
jgi:hypothetical protein